MSFKYLYLIRLILVFLNFQATFQFQIESNGKEFNVSIADSDLLVFKVKSYQDDPILDKTIQLDHLTILKNESNGTQANQLINSFRKKDDSTFGDVSKNFYLIDSINYQQAPFLFHESEPFKNDYEGDLKIEFSDSDPVYTRLPYKFKPITYVKKETRSKLKVNKKNPFESFLTSTKSSFQEFNSSQIRSPFSFNLYHLYESLKPKSIFTLPDWLSFFSNYPYNPYKLFLFYKPSSDESFQSEISSWLFRGLPFHLWHFPTIAIEKVEVEPLIKTSLSPHQYQQKKNNYPIQKFLMSIKSTRAKDD